MVARVALWGGRRLRWASEPVSDAWLRGMIQRVAERVGLKTAPAVGGVKRNVTWLPAIAVAVRPDGGSGIVGSPVIEKTWRAVSSVMASLPSPSARLPAAAYDQSTCRVARLTA